MDEHQTWTRQRRGARIFLQMDQAGRPRPAGYARIFRPAGSRRLRKFWRQGLIAMKAIAYCRVSAAGDEPGDVSLAVQQKQIRSWCAAKRRPLAGIYHETVRGEQIAN